MTRNAVFRIDRLFARRRGCVILMGMKEGTDNSERSVKRRICLAWILSGIVLGVSLLIAVLSAVRGHTTEIDLQNYVNVGTDAGGNPVTPKAVIPPKGKDFSLPEAGGEV